MLERIGVGLLPKYPPARFVELVRACERLGYGGVWVPDERFYRDLYPMLTLAALHTERCSIGSAVTDPYLRHPAITANAMATVDEISGGRLVVGISAGISGFGALNLPRSRPLRALKEGVAILRGLFSGDPLDYEGESYQLRGARLYYRPRRDIPIFVAGTGPHMLELAASQGDGVIIGDLASPKTLTYALAHIDRGARSAGRDPQGVVKMVWLQTFVSSDRQEALQRAKRFVALLLVGTRAFHHRFGVDLPQDLIEALERQAESEPERERVTSLIPDELVRHFTLAGNPLECARQVRELLEQGIDQVGVHPWVPTEAQMTEDPWSCEGPDLKELIEALAVAVRDLQTGRSSADQGGSDENAIISR